MRRRCFRILPLIALSILIAAYKCVLLAVSGPSFQVISVGLNVRFTLGSGHSANIGQRVR